MIFEGELLEGDQKKTISFRSAYFAGKIFFDSSASLASLR